MRFLFDESADARLIRHLRSLGHDVKAIGREFTKSLSDREVLNLAVREQRILVTNDSDFGALVFFEQLAHTGVILLRLAGNADLDFKKQRLCEAVARQSENPRGFLVPTNSRLRARHLV